jgi:hypothetical protein
MWAAFIDWPCSVDWEAIAAFTNAAAILIAALVASKTFDNWRKQTLFTRHSAFAEEVLTQFYAFRKAIDEARGPMTTGPQLEEARTALREDYDIQNPTDQVVNAQAMLNKLNRHNDLIESIFGNLARCKAVFGNETHDAFFETIKAQHSFRVYVNAYARDRVSGDEFAEKIDSFIWKGYAEAVGEKPDPIDTPLDDAEHILEERLTKFIRDKEFA